MVQSYADDKSYPAAPAEPRAGSSANSEIFFTRRTDMTEPSTS